MRFAFHRLLIGIVATALASGIASAVPVPPPLRFDRIFAAAGEPVQLHYRVVYLAGSAPHRLDVWRDGDRRLKRLTDGALASYATHIPGKPGYRLTILDLKRHISTRIDRTSLYRLGNFSDWFDLGHGLRHPLGAYRLTAASAPPRAVAPVRPCRWYDLSQGEQVTHICWDQADRLPLLILSADGRAVWRITTIDRAPIRLATFAVHDAGFTHNDADRDLASD